MRGPRLVPLIRRLAGAPDPLALYASLTDGGRRPDTLLLESAEGAAGPGRRSLLIVRSMARLTCRGGDVQVDPLSPNGVRLASGLPLRFDSAPTERLEDRERLTAAGPLDALRAAVLDVPLAQETDFPGHMAAGILSYDFVELSEPLPPPRHDADGFPHYVFWVPDRLIAIDHRHGATTILALADETAGPAAIHDAARDIEGLVRRVEEAADRGIAPATARPSSRPEACDLPDPEFRALVQRLQHHVRAGDVFQIVPSRTFTAPCGAPLASYARLRASNPSPYQFFVRAPGFTLFGASPETAVKVDSARRVIVRPIAGTAPRGCTPQGDADADHDARLQAALMTDPKELAEHMMLVDLARNDVARIGRPGTRAVTRLLEVERYRHVMHLVSEVTGELDEGLDALHAWSGCLNAGTVVGAPKRRAAELLRLHEATRRGPYGGAVGYLTRDGRLDSALVIRSAFVKDGVARVRAGAGVVLDSDPGHEAEETRRKAAAVLQAIEGEEAA